MANEPVFPPHSRVQFPRGSTAQNNGYIGKEGEFTVDLIRMEIRLHDGKKPGGHRFLSLTALQSIFLSLDSEAAKLNFPGGALGFLTRVSDEAYAVRKLTALNGLVITNPDGVDNPNDSVNGDPIFDLPTRLHENQVAIVNANLHAVQSGFYCTNAETINIPVELIGVAAGFMMVVRENDQQSTQVLMSRQEKSQVFIRSQLNGAWQPWLLVSPVPGDIEILNRGTDLIQRVWSADELNDWFMEKIQDLGGGDVGTSNPTLYNSKRQHKDKVTYDDSSSTPAFTKSIANFKIGDRYVVKATASKAVTHPAENKGCDINISLKLGSKMIEVLSAEAPIKDGGRTQGPYEDQQFTAYRLTNGATLRFVVVDGGAGAKKIVVVDTDWAITNDLTDEGDWDGTIQYDVSNGTRQVDVSCYRLRAAA